MGSRTQGRTFCVFSIAHAVGVCLVCMQAGPGTLCLRNVVFCSGTYGQDYGYRAARWLAAAGLLATAKASRSGAARRTASALTSVSHTRDRKNSSAVAGWSRGLDDNVHAPERRRAGRSDAI